MSGGLRGGRISELSTVAGGGDLETGRGVLEVLQDLHQQGRTLLVVTHNAAIATIAHRGVRMRSGQITEITTTSAPGAAAEVSWCQTHRSHRSHILRMTRTLAIGADSDCNILTPRAEAHFHPSLNLPSFRVRFTRRDPHCCTAFQQALKTSSRSPGTNILLW